MTTASPIAVHPTINRLGMAGVYNTSFDVYNQELSPPAFMHVRQPVDSCARRYTARKLGNAGVMTCFPQSTALITRTILKYEFLMSITSRDADKGDQREISL